MRAVSCRSSRFVSRPFDRPFGAVAFFRSALRARDFLLERFELFDAARSFRSDAAASTRRKPEREFYARLGPSCVPSSKRRLRCCRGFVCRDVAASASAGIARPSCKAARFPRSPPAACTVSGSISASSSMLIGFDCHQSRRRPAARRGGSLSANAGYFPNDQRGTG